MLTLIAKRSVAAVKHFSLPKAFASTVSGKTLFTKDHEWVNVAGDVGTVGISDHAQKALGDVVFVELPEVGAKLEQNDKSGAVESVKAVSDVYSPVSGTITEVNEALKASPGLINKSCYQDGWLFKLKLSKSSELNELMDRAKYEQFLKDSDH